MVVHKYKPWEGIEHSCFKKISYCLVHLAICMWCIIALIQSDCCQIMGLAANVFNRQDSAEWTGCRTWHFFHTLIVVCAHGSVYLLWAAKSECSSEIHSNPAEGIIYIDCIWILSDTHSLTNLRSFFLFFILPQLPSVSLFYTEQFGTNVLAVSQIGYYLGVCKVSSW